MKRLVGHAIAFWTCNAIALILAVLTLWHFIYRSDTSPTPWLLLFGWMAFTVVATFVLQETAQSMIMGLSSSLGSQTFAPLLICLLVLFLPGLVFFGLYHWARHAYQQRTLEHHSHG
ncbi:MAG: hypothetical protein WC497_03860 [Patescibacteria group bacterium]